MNFSLHFSDFSTIFSRFLKFTVWSTRSEVCLLPIGPQILQIGPRKELGARNVVLHRKSELSGFDFGERRRLEVGEVGRNDEGLTLVRFVCLLGSEASCGGPATCGQGGGGGAALFRQGWQRWS